MTRYCDICGELVTNCKYMKLMHPHLPALYQTCKTRYDRMLYWCFIFFGVIPVHIDLCSKCYKKNEKHWKKTRCKV